MDKYTAINSELIDLIKQNSMSIEHLKFNSFEWQLYTAGLCYGIWTSICDQTKISLEEINEILVEISKSNLN